MLTHFDDLDRTLATMNELRRRVERLYEEMQPGPTLDHDVERMWNGRFPRVSLHDAGTTLVLEADVPGLGEKDVQLTIHQEVLTLSGERKQDVPQGYYVHRQERAPVKFSRSFALPCKVDPDASTAALKSGVLTVTLAKAAEAKPRHIAVTAR
jgi:HSP20 family protein